ncbi:MAG: HD domain-containing protein [Patescibacteria group bacterium]|nr:HD domain-containing protein [Patescibacteria group bacterium]
MKMTPKIQKAIIKATILHYPQKRKADNTPYITHPYSVAFILTNYTENEDVIAAGLLHDVFEDVPDYTADDMKKDFGEKVYKIVKEVSENKNPTDSDAKDKATWEERKKKYLNKLRNDSEQALMVCCADKIHSLSSLIESYNQQGDIIWQKFNAPADKQLWFYGEVLTILKERLNSNIVQELEKDYIQAKTIFNL